MKSITPSIKYSGWLYLWLCLMIIVIWMNHSGHLNLITKINQDVRTLFTPPSTKSSNLVRVIDINFDKDSLLKINKLSERHPYATFSLLGAYSSDFLQALSTQKFNWLSKKTVLLNQNNLTSLSAIKTSGNLFQLAITEIDKLHWKTSNSQHIAIQPNHQQFGSQLIYQYKNESYLSFIGKTVINFVQSKIESPSKILVNYSSRNNLMLDDVYFAFGLRGEVVTNGLPPKNQTYEALLSNEHSDFSGVILIDDLSHQYSNEISKAISNTLDNQYVTTSWLSVALELIFLLTLLLTIFLIQKMRLYFQFIIILLCFSMLFFIQHLFTSQHIWISLNLIIVVSVISLLVQKGYMNELKQKIMIERNSSIPVKTTENVPPLTNNNLDKTIITNRNNDIETEFMSETMLESTSSETLAQTIDLGKTIVIDSNKQTIIPSSTSFIKIEKFGRYQVDGVLGRGAMGVVFRGVDPKINRLVAIKTMQLSDDLDSETLEETKQRFFREAETAGNLSHANIVTIYDVGEQEQVNTNQSLGYIAMDLLTGAPLSEYTTKGKLLPPSLVYQLMIQIADALDYAHQQNVVHRDIKPANIIYDDDLNRGTLTDFGIAYMADQSKTKTGLIMGSPYYMSPEQIAGKSIDGRSDIFSLGATFYQLLTGHLPFTGENIATVTYQIANTKHDTIKQWNTKLRTSAVRITNKALQKDPDKRFQTMYEFKQTLINALKRDYKRLPLS